MAGLAKKEAKFYKNWKIAELKQYLQARGISVSNKKKGRISPVVELTEKAHELAIELTDDSESISDVVNAKLVAKRWYNPESF